MSFLVLASSYALADVECESGRRCLDDQLQECMYNSWHTLTKCKNGCDSQSLACKTEKPPGEKLTGSAAQDMADFGENPVSLNYIITALVIFAILAAGWFYYHGHKKLRRIKGEK